MTESLRSAISNLIDHYRDTADELGLLYQLEDAVREYLEGPADTHESLVSLLDMSRACTALDQVRGVKR